MGCGSNQYVRSILELDVGQNAKTKSSTVRRDLTYRWMICNIMPFNGLSCRFPLKLKMCSKPFKWCAATSWFPLVIGKDVRSIRSSNMFLCSPLLTPCLQQPLSSHLTQPSSYRLASRWWSESLRLYDGEAWQTRHLDLYRSESSGWRKAELSYAREPHHLLPAETFVHSAVLNWWVIVARYGSG